MNLEITIEDITFDVVIDIQEGQPQTLEQEGVDFAIDVESVKLSGFFEEELVGLLSDKTIESIEKAALEALIELTF